MHRRTLLAGSALLPLAGCVAFSDDSDGSDDSDDSDDRDLPDLAGTFDDFGDLDQWSTTSGSVSVDPDRALVGSQAVHLSLPHEQSLRLSRELEEPLDVSDVVPGLAVASDGLLIPWVRLVDENGSVASYRRALVGGLAIQRYNFGIDFIEEGFDETAVTELQVQVSAAAGDRTIWLDDFHFVPRPETGRVMVQFDDCHETDYTEALPRLEKHGIPAATFVNPRYIELGTVAGDSRLSVDQCHELDQAGWTVCNHTWSHANLEELDHAAQEEEIVRGKTWLEDEGFEEGARYFCYPFGNHNSTTVDLVRKHHAIGYHGGLPAPGYTANTELAPRIGEPTADEIGEILSLTAEHRGLTAFFYHRLEEQSDIDQFEAMLDALVPLVESGELEPILPPEVEDRYLF